MRAASVSAWVPRVSSIQGFRVSTFSRGPSLTQKETANIGVTPTGEIERA